MFSNSEAHPAKRQCPPRNESGGRAPSSSAVTASLADAGADQSLTDEESKKRDLLLTPGRRPLVSVAEAAACIVKGGDDDEDDRGVNLQQYHCDACQKDITNVFRIRCGECLDFDLCVSCFTSGIETGCHRNDHSYIPVGRNDFPIFTPDWNADEEVMLLEGVSKFGFGNWAEVAELVAPYNVQPKRKEQCEEHYYSVHILPYRDQTKTPELPSDATERRAELQRRMLGKYYYPVPQPIKPSAGGNAACNVVGFMPLRGDFDVEYDNDAELILSDIEFRGDETPQERELKLKVLDIYNARVDERILRKKVVIEKGLVDWRRAQQLGRRRGKEEVDFHNLFRLLVRYNLEPDHEELANLFLAERRLRHRVRLLNEWKSLGLRTFQEVEAYEELKNSKISGAPVSTATPLSAKEKPRSQARRITVDSQDSASRITTTGQADEVEGAASGSNGVMDTANSSTLTETLPFELEGPASTYPGASLLTEKELEFCDTLQIPPAYFLFTKHSLVNALIQHSDPQTLYEAPALRLGKAFVNNMENADSDATRQGSLYDFVLHAKFDMPRPQASSFPKVKENVSERSPSLSRKTRTRRRQQQLILDFEDDTGPPPSTTGAAVQDDKETVSS